MDIPANPQGHSKSELPASLLGPLLRGETEAWEAEHSGLSRRMVQVRALDLPLERSLALVCVG